MIRLDQRTATRMILAVRLLLGPLCVLFPRFTSKWVMFTDPDLNPATPYFLRLFGGRDAFLGIAALIAEEPTRTKLIESAAGIDAIDATAAVLAGLKGQIPKRAALLAAIAGSIGSLLGLAAAGRGPLARHTPQHSRPSMALRTLRPGSNGSEQRGEPANDVTEAEPDSSSSNRMGVL